RRRLHLLRGEALVEQHRADGCVAEDRRPRARGDRSRVPVVVEGGVADEDHVRRLELVRRDRRSRVLAQERVDEDAVRRPDDLVPSGAEVPNPRAHAWNPCIVSQLFTSGTNERLSGTGTPFSSAARTTAPLITSISVGRPAWKSCI